MSNQQMKQAFPPDVCQRCGGELNIALFVAVPAKGEIAENGEIVIFDQDRPYIEDVSFYECYDCGALNEDTGLELSQEGGFFYLRPIDDQAG